MATYRIPECMARCTCNVHLLVGFQIAGAVTLAHTTQLSRVVPASYSNRGSMTMEISCVGQPPLTPHSKPTLPPPPCSWATNYKPPHHSYLDFLCLLLDSMCTRILLFCLWHRDKTAVPVFLLSNFKTLPYIWLSTLFVSFKISSLNFIINITLHLANNLRTHCLPLAGLSCLWQCQNWPLPQDLC